MRKAKVLVSIFLIMVILRHALRRMRISPMKKEVVRVGLVSSSSGFGDGAFNDLTLKGVERAKSEFGIEYDKVQIKAVGDIELSLRDMASTGDYDLIIGLTYEAIQAMKTVAPEFPDQKFAFD